MQTGREEPVGRTLDYSKRRLNWMTLARRPRQLRDEDKSCGTQPAYIRVIYRRLLLLMSCLISVCLNKESAGPPRYFEGLSGPADKWY